MVGRQLIVSLIFNAKGKLSTSMKRNLMVRGGGGVQLGDCLSRHGWDGSAPAATVILTLDPESGIIRGARFGTIGKGPEVCFKAGDLWGEARDDIMIKVKFSDLSTVSWITTGERRNQSEWLDSESLEVEATHPELGQLANEQLEDFNIKGFSCRFTLLPVKHNKVFLYGGIIPLAKEDLLVKLRELEIEENSPRVPTVAMKPYFFKGKYQNALPIDLIPAEQPDDRIGLGVLPLL